MAHFKLFEQFINEAAGATSLWTDENQMINDCKHFLMSNIHFNYSDVIHPEPGWGAFADDFKVRGLVNLRVILKDGLYFKFNHYIDPESSDYKKRRSEFVKDKNGGRAISFMFFSGTNSTNRGIVLLNAVGNYYNVGSYEDPSRFSGLMKKIWPGMQSSDNDEQFINFMSDLNIDIIPSRVVDSQWPKQWQKK